MAALSCYIEGCDAEDRSARSVEGHIKKIHNDNEPISVVYNAFPMSQQATKTRRQLAKPAPGEICLYCRSDCKMITPAFTAISNKPQALDSEDVKMKPIKSENGVKDEKPHEDNEGPNDDLMSVGSDIDSSASGRNLNTSVAEGIQNLSTVLGTKLDNIQSAIEQLAMATQQRNKLFTQLLSVLTKDGEMVLER